MEQTINTLKETNLVEFMSRCWQVEFTQEGKKFIAHSPFRQEQDPSFYVSQEDDGHWVYYDHGSGRGGTIIDAIMTHDGHSDVGLAIRTAQAMAKEVGLLTGELESTDRTLHAPKAESAKVDLEWLHGKLCGNGSRPARDYLVSRGISEELVEDLIRNQVVMTNQLDESVYCCFAVRDSNGRLHSLFNRKISGPSPRERFLLGGQYPFCLDWNDLMQTPRIHICESIIDALSVHTLQPGSCAVALPGVNYDLAGLSFIPSHATLIESFDMDQAGRRAAERLRKHFHWFTIEEIDLGEAHDVNELLCSTTVHQEEQQAEEINKPGDLGQGKLSIEARVKVALNPTPSRQLADEFDVHHSRICDIRNDASTILTEAWENRRPGRKPSPVISDEVEQQQRELQELKKEFDLLKMRNEWLELQVKIGEERIQEAARKGKARKKKQRRKQRK